MMGPIDVVSGQAAVIPGRYKDSTDPVVFAEELNLTQSSIVLQWIGDAGTAESSVNTTEEEPTEVACGNNVIGVPLTAADLSRVGQAILYVNAAGALPREFLLNVRSSPDRHIVPRE